MLPSTFSKIPFLILGHRGSPRKMIENTIASFEQALREGASGVEFDIRLSRDHEIFVFHDDSLERMTGQSGFFKDKRSREIRKIQCKIVHREPRDSGIPTLAEVIHLLKKRSLFYIEFKVEQCSRAEKKTIAEKTIRLLEKQHVLDQALLVPFDYEVIRIIKQMDSRCLTGFNFHYFKDLAAPGRDHFKYLDCLCPWERCLSVRMMDLAKGHDLDVLPWVVNDLKTLKKITKLGIRKFVSDMPGKMAERVKIIR